MVLLRIALLRILILSYICKRIDVCMRLHTVHRAWIFQIYHIEILYNGNSCLFIYSCKCFVIAGFFVFGFNGDACELCMFLRIFWNGKTNITWPVRTSNVVSRSFKSVSCINWLDISTFTYSMQQWIW